MDIPRMGSKYPGPLVRGNAADGVLGSSVVRYHYFTMKQASHTMVVIGVGSGTESTLELLFFTGVMNSSYE